MSKVGKLNKDASSVSEEKDPERLLKLKECCDILLAGGYFRARIPTLSPFDKVVGGVVWAMTASAVDIEVDIIFTENSTIGQKIKLSDQICKSLVAMKCPYPLQSHQIQGLDYDHLFPILQWLVRKVIETRRIMGDVVRAQSCQQFDKFFQKFPSELLDNNDKEKIKTQRKFKKKLNANFDNIYSRVEATLLEYGEKLYGLGKPEEESESGADKGNKGKNRSSLINKFETGKTAEQKKKEEEELKKKKQEEEEQRLKSLEEQLLSAGVGGKISGANVGSLVGMQADEIRRAAEDYEAQLKKQIEEEEASGASSKKGQEAAHNRAVDAIKKKINAAGEELKKKEGSQQEAQQKLEELKELLNKKLAYNEKIIRETEKLDAIEGEGNNKEILIKLRSLVAMNETLKSQEAAFKAQCIQERNDLMDQLKKLEGGESGGGGDEEIKKMLEIESIYENDLGKLNKIRRVLAKKNQEISKILRQIDDIPTRAELIQYERRFIELYELVASKLIETRKYYSMYNTLSDSHRYMSQEVNLLNSIIESFPKAINSSVKSNRDNFIEQMEKILDGVDKTKAMVKNQSDEEGNNRELLLSKYNQLIDKQRNYFKAVKEFQLECNKNEKLMAALESGIPMDETNIEKNDD